MRNFLIWKVIDTDIAAKWIIEKNICQYDRGKKNEKK